jgi:hypothetical protein
MDYQLCKATPAFCEFNAKLASSKSCRDVCAKLGGECAATFHNGQPCDYQPNDVGCDASNSIDAVCRCSLGCGNGLPCTGSQVCSGGTCKP